MHPSSYSPFISQNKKDELFLWIYALDNAVNDMMRSYFKYMYSIILCFFRLPFLFIRMRSGACIWSRSETSWPLGPLSFYLSSISCNVACVTEPELLWLLYLNYCGYCSGWILWERLVKVEGLCEPLCILKSRLKVRFVFNYMYM